MPSLSIMLIESFSFRSMPVRCHVHLPVQLCSWFHPVSPRSRLGSHSHVSRPTAMSLQSVLEAEGLQANIIKRAVDAGWSVSAFKHVVDTSAELEQALPDIFGEVELSRLQKSQIRAAWAGLWSSVLFFECLEKIELYCSKKNNNEKSFSELRFCEMIVLVLAFLNFSDRLQHDVFVNANNDMS